ncbi:unnamed protein product [Dibothriocephalus latus]|uniref:Uncharacterized protein n=1 Tax=Dibothriocephalus latus TaxID=60516 RepID=A0A3P7PXK8_DIBLA|nr:unnamed protein product [Dibothriocephalus latus]
MTNISADCGPYGNGEQASGQTVATAHSDYSCGLSFDRARQPLPDYDERWLTGYSDVQPTGPDTSNVFLEDQLAPHESIIPPDAPDDTLCPTTVPNTINRNRSRRRRTVFVVLPPTAQDNRRKRATILFVFLFLYKNTKISTMLMTHNDFVKKLDYTFVSYHGARRVEVFFLNNKALVSDLNASKRTLAVFRFVGNHFEPDNTFESVYLTSDCSHQ